MTSNHPQLIVLIGNFHVDTRHMRVDSVDGLRVLDLPFFARLCVHFLEMFNAFDRLHAQATGDCIAIGRLL